MTNQTEQQLLTFWDFLHKYNIEIPIIQRDYAQGRTENLSIRLTFLDAIYKCITNIKPINLDFIYGSIANDNIFQPLDGQQRLTTLYLLHLYAYKKDIQNNETVSKLFAKFSYQTRISAKEFCDELARQDLIVDKNREKISEIIEDSEWYYLSWKNDPTIRAMLIMLDAIHSKFKDIDNLFNILTEKNLITFYYLILEDFGLSDDLYIKMNARGKLLSSFENLKAEIQQKSKDLNWENDVEEIEKFAYKIDGPWTDLMWDNYRNSNNDDVDDSHMRLISTITMIHLALSSQQESTEKQNIIQKLNFKFDDRSLINYIDKKTFEYIKKTYDKYGEILSSSIDMNLDFKFWAHKFKIALLDEVVFDCATLPNANSSYTTKVLFFAQTEYLLRNKDFIKDNFQDWMRVVRNIIVRGDINLNTKDCSRTALVRSPKAFISTINLINELADGSNDIYNYLCDATIKSSYQKEQIKEEKIKARIITKYPQYKNLIHKLENIDILKGKILFALQCADYDNIDIESIDWHKLEDVSNVLEKYFNSETSILTNELRRAMLTIEVGGCYSFYNYWQSTCAILEDAPHKRRLIESFNELEYIANHEQYSQYLRKLVLLLINKTYDEIISEFYNCPNDRLYSIPDWQIRIIIEPELLDEKCKSYYIAISDSKDNHKTCYLLPNSRPRDIAKCIKL